MKHNIFWINKLKTRRWKPYCILVSVLFINKIVSAQFIPGVGSITGLVNSVINEIDLKIQRKQYRIMLLENNQKTVAMEMMISKIKEFEYWQQNQKNLLQNYFFEVQKVKSDIEEFPALQQIRRENTLMLKTYKQVWPILIDNGYFNEKQISYMSQVYANLLTRALNSENEVDKILKDNSLNMDNYSLLNKLDDIAIEVHSDYQLMLSYHTQNLILCFKNNTTDNDNKTNGP